MALPSTVHKLRIALSDVERNRYETIETRIARHPSETGKHLVARALAWALSYEEGLELGPGLCVGDEPAMSIRSLDGRLTAFIDVGTPSGEKLHHARKACERVIVYTHHDPALLLREVKSTRIHALETIEAFAFDRKLVDALEARLERTLDWELLRSDGMLYVTVGGATLEGPVTRLDLVDERG